MSKVYFSRGDIPRLVENNIDLFDFDQIISAESNSLSMQKQKTIRWNFEPWPALGDFLLSLSITKYMTEIPTFHQGVFYTGPRARLMQRSTLNIDKLSYSKIPQMGNSEQGIKIECDPNPLPLFVRSTKVNGLVESFSALPWRYRIMLSRRFKYPDGTSGIPSPQFRSTIKESPGKVTFVDTTSLRSKKSYGRWNFLRLATDMIKLSKRKLSFALITNEKDSWINPLIDVIQSPDDLTCLDLFAESSCVIGNDSGLTHLAAMTVRTDNSVPQVFGIHSRHSAWKWNTGHSNHHAFETSFSRLMTITDCCPVRDHIEDQPWGGDAFARSIPASFIASSVVRTMGW